jgi:uncharacterized protein involved in exopolysaccharide biosynthesis
MDTLVRQDLASTAPPVPPGTAAGEATAPAGAAALAAPDLARYVRALVDARGRILAFTAGATAAAVLLAFVLPRQWTARVVLLPTDEADGALPAQLSGLVSSFGLQFPFGPASQSDLYPTILTSDRLLAGLLAQEFRRKADEPARPLLAHLVRNADDTHATRSKAIRRLRRDIVTAAKDSETGIVSLEVTMASPLLAAGAANALTAGLERYLIEIRQQDGAKNRAFIDERLAAVSADLASAEECLTRFREENRRIGGSPELQLEEARLQRDVLFQEQVFVELKKQKEIAGIEEVKNTPVLKVLDPAVPPSRPSRPVRALVVAAGLLLGAFGSVSWVLVHTALSSCPDLAAALAPLARDARRAGVRLPRRRLYAG